jgi:hypothetical protein
VVNRHDKFPECRSQQDFSGREIIRPI